MDAKSNVALEGSDFEARERVGDDAEGNSDRSLGWRRVGKEAQADLFDILKYSCVAIGTLEHLEEEVPGTVFPDWVPVHTHSRDLVVRRVADYGESSCSGMVIEDLVGK